ncbi:MAG: SDR family NAD(P)-dependent oxidoreductase [Desulfobacteraceae bacterium]|jgi:meso-butanediol dehydrogenase/(S,S)-butanediol dehydrogenase/diacetyl reductase|nr:SDR family NAD(P)-dependent oxidoreductase [Desulfobacteraceae bacterium]
MSLPLEGKVALVTGGGRGIGEGIVKRLAEAGCDVAVVDIILENAGKVAEDVQTMGRRAVAIQADVTKRDQIQGMVTPTTC